MQGHNTLTMTLPAEWLKKFNIKPGDEINLSEKDNGLFISIEKINGGKKAEFNIDGMDIPTIWKYFMAVYREGYDEVSIRFSPDTKLESPYKFFTQHKADLKYEKKCNKKTAIEFFHEMVNRFLGFEVTDHGKDFVLIKELSQATSKEFENSLRRVFLLIQQMSEETCEALKTKNPKILSHIHDVDINLDKFHDYCIRILNKNINKDQRKTSLLFSTLYLLELTGDEFKNISHHLIYDFGKADFKNIEDLADSIRQQFNLYYGLFYKYDLNLITEISTIDKNRYFEVLKIYKKTKNEEEKEIFHHLRIISRYINALLELRIEMEF